jgi:hypothetical protein
MVSVPELATKRGWRCEICGLETRALERHHCLIHRRKGHPEFDDERNLEMLCSICHEKYANSFEHKREFWAKQKIRYPDMEEWYQNLPLKVKENFD